MYFFARGSRLVAMWLLAVMCVAIPAAAVISDRPIGIIVAAFVVSIFGLFGGALMWASVRKQEAASVSQEPGVRRVLEVRLTRRSYGALRSLIFQRGLFYHAAMRVWLAVGPDSWRIYCVVPAGVGEPFLLATCESGPRHLGSRGRVVKVESADDGIGLLELRAAPFSRMKLLQLAQVSN
jgi:hypothetical protein